LFNCFFAAIQYCPFNLSVQEDNAFRKKIFRNDRIEASFVIFIFLLEITGSCGRDLRKW
jgi:hypothetical protein